MEKKLTNNYKKSALKKIFLFVFATLFFFSCKKSNNSAPGTLPGSYSNQALGASAHDMLSGAKYTAIHIEVQYMPGYQLDPTAITNVTNYLETLCNKPNGVTISQTQIAANGDTLNVSQVAVIEAQNRTAYTSGATLALYVLVTDGYDTSLNVLGFAFRNTSICLFGKDMFDHSGGVGEVTRISIESSVLEHELGHIMGLVNLGTPMVIDHQDVANGNHCINPNCLMYYATETHKSLVGFTNAVPVLDSNCRNDLHAYGGK